MKLAITGKGGTGKTTIAALLAESYVKEGKKVLAVDCDPSWGLPQALGCPGELRDKITPISEMKELIKERTGADPDSFGSMFKLNPYVSDIPEKYVIKLNGIKIIVMGGIKKGGGGCACPANVFIKNLIGELLLKKDEVVIMDMEAGIEPLGRATVKAIDGMIVVVDPSQRSFEVARKIKNLSCEVGIKKVFLIANKIKDNQQYEIARKKLEDFIFLGHLSYCEELIKLDLEGKGVQGIKAICSQIEGIRQDIERYLKG
jgi:CO dehydrogenase maturation factor